MFVTRFSIFVALTALLGGAAVTAADNLLDTKKFIASKLNGVATDDINETPIEGMFEVALGAQVAYISQDGRYLVKGEIIDLKSGQNMTESRRETARVKALAKFDESDMIVFSPDEPRHTITIFTDVDCGYCRKLHAEVDELNALGVKVQYLMYPRYGEVSPQGTPAASWVQAENVWCSKDRNDALTRAKRGEKIEAESCSTPIKQHYEMGQMVGFGGTPAIVTENGTLISGYLPAELLVQRLDALAQSD